MVTTKSQKIPKFSCEICQYITDNKKDFEKHVSTLKHIKLTLANGEGDGGDNKNPMNHYVCISCNKMYVSRNGLWKHNKKCLTKNTNSFEQNITENVSDKDELIDYLIKENQEFKKLILEIVKRDTYHNNNNTTNSHNKTFNLQFFLNETCKDAMNIMEFVESIKLQLSDLERVGELGYVEGISNIIVKNLKALDVTQRPVHCTDKKRETLYIKDENKWEKDEERKKMHTMVKRIANKNARLLPKFKEEHPDCGTSSSKFSDQYNKIIVESMGGPGNNDYEKEEKIIRRVTKEIIVEKEIL